MSWTRKISHANEMLKRGDIVECQVLSVDEDRKRIALGLKQLAGDPWETTIPEKFQPGTIVTGKVTKITNFGVFVELEPELEGLLHISELADHKVDNPEEIVKVGQEIEVRVLRVDSAERKIGLSRRLQGSDGTPEGEAEEAARGTAAPAREELKGGTGSGAAGPLFTMGSPSAADSEPPAEESAAP
jgi:small subunit ribosomal protein S1